MLFKQYAGLKKEIYILFIGKLVTAMGSFVHPMLTFLLTRKLSLSDSTATLLIATATTLSFPAALIGGKLADRFSRKKIIILFDLVTVTLCVLSAILPIGLHTAVLIFLSGLFQTIEAPAYDALDSDFSTTEQREKAFSLSYLGFNLGYIVGAALAGILFENYTQLAFLLNGVSILVSTLLILFFVDPKNAVGQKNSGTEYYGPYEIPVDEKRSVMSVLRERKVVLWMILVGCVASMPNTVVGILLPLQLNQSLKEAGSAVYGYLNSLNGFTVILFTPFLTMLLRRITEIPKTVAGLLLFIAGIAFFTVGQPVPLLYIGMFVYTLGEVVSVLGMNPYASRRVPASHRGRVGGISSVVYSLFASLTQYLIAFVLMLTENDYTLLWLAFTGCGLVAAVFYCFLYLPDKRTFPKLYTGEPLA